MNFKIDEQIREYNLLKDRFVDTETELRKLRDTLKVVQKKASKVDELEAQIKTLEQKNEQLKNCLNKNRPTKERNETVKEIRKETLSFAKVLTQNEKQYNKIGNCNERQLDLVLSTRSVEKELEVRAAEPIVPPDPHHPPLAIVVQRGRARYGGQPAPAPLLAESEGSNQTHTGWNFCKANFPLMYSLFIYFR
ncbi:unnamed protein product [Parnassius apollo]|uniref:(apollo) hypothetical protein n=1 Tax=Parnassius apollo TaxID=110799 RepID=A0A8S3WAU1_PARAO|nr:unnamed protein product [Parnassius apollo]